MNFNEINFAVDGDSITQGDQWSYHVSKILGTASHYNVGVGSSVWYKRTINVNGTGITTQDYDSPDFAGISGGWEPTDDVHELQMRMNNCAVVHIQRYLSDVKKGLAPKPDVFAFAFGTNDCEDYLGDIDTTFLNKGLDEVNLFCEAGAIRWCLQTISENFPDCRIFVLTPIQAADPRHNRKNRKIIENIKTVCSEMSVQVIDMYSNCGICEKFEVIGGEGRYLRDGLHPKENGQALMGAYAAMEIRNRLF